MSPGKLCGRHGGPSAPAIYLAFSVKDEGCGHVNLVRKVDPKTQIKLENRTIHVYKTTIIMMTIDTMMMMIQDTS